MWAYVSAWTASASRKEDVVEKTGESKKRERPDVVQKQSTDPRQHEAEKPDQPPSVASRDNPFFEGLAKALSI
jgi:hypothetical protein